MEKSEGSLTSNSSTEGGGNNISCFGQPSSAVFQKFHFALMWLLFASIITGNAIVLAAVGLSKTKRKSRMTFFIFNLALADLLVGLASVFYETMVLTTGSRWYGGKFLCAFASYLSDVVTYSSSYVLVALSIDRLHAIARPMSFINSGLRAKLLISAAWIFASIFGIPQLVFRTVKYDPLINGEACLIQFPEAWIFRPYFSLSMVAAVLVPAVIIGACYAAIIYIIWTKGKVASTPTTPITEKYSKRRSEYSKKSMIREENGLSGAKCSSRGVIPQAKIRTVKMTLVIVLTFIICWSPYSLYNLMSVYDVLPCFRHSLEVTQMIQSLAPLNSAVNPVIYGIFSTRICQHLRKLSLCNWIAKRLCCCCCPKYSSRGSASLAGNTDYSVVPDSEVGIRMTPHKSSNEMLSRMSIGDRDEIVMKPMRSRQPDDT